MTPSFLQLLVKGQFIDRRALYGLLALSIALPIVFTAPQPKPVIMPETVAYYQTIEKIAADPIARKKLVIVSANYGSGTLAENQTQTEATMRHLMRHRLKFAIFCFGTPQGRELAQAVAEKLQREFDYQYGRDYFNIGFRPTGAIETTLKAAVEDFPGAFEKDINGTPLTDIPAMQGVKKVDDIGLIIEITPSETLVAWLQFFQRAGENPIPTLYCPTAVMGPEKYPLLKSGQLQGMVMGLRGANEYEELLHMNGFGHRGSASLSYAHLLIVLLIVLGNAGMYAERALRRQSGLPGQAGLRGQAGRQ